MKYIKKINENDNEKNIFIGQESQHSIDNTNSRSGTSEFAAQEIKDIIETCNNQEKYKWIITGLRGDFVGTFQTYYTKCDWFVTISEKEMDRLYTKAPNGRKFLFGKKYQFKKVKDPHRYNNYVYIVYIDCGGFNVELGFSVEFFESNFLSPERYRDRLINDIINE